MKPTSHSLLVAVALATCSAAPLAKAAPDSNAPCADLAAHARNVAAEGWKQGVEPAMAPALRIDKQRNPTFPKDPGDPFERSLTELPWVRTALDNDNGNWSEFVSRLPGQGIYMVSTYQGTLHCQTAVFIRTQAGAEPKSMEGPAVLGEGEGPCWTQSGELGTVGGAPAFVEGGADDDHTFDTSYAVVPWTGEGWGKGCKLTLQFRTKFALKARHCGDKAVCRAAGGVVLDVAKAYEHFRRSFNSGDKTGFAFGPADRAAAANRQLIEGRPFVNDIPEFPRFGGPDETTYGGSFSYSGFQYLPLRLAGRWHVAAIGHEGVGWRESDRTLIAIYDVSADGALKPEASFEVQAINGGLIQAKAEPGA